MSEARLRPSATSNHPSKAHPAQPSPPCLLLGISVPLPQRFLRAHDINWSNDARTCPCLNRHLTSSAACSRTTDAARSAGPRWATRSVYNFPNSSWNLLEPAKAAPDHPREHDKELATWDSFEVPSANRNHVGCCPRKACLRNENPHWDPGILHGRHSMLSMKLGGCCRAALGKLRLNCFGHGQEKSASIYVRPRRVFPRIKTRRH